MLAACASQRILVSARRLVCLAGNRCPPTCHCCSSLSRLMLALPSLAVPEEPQAVCLAGCQAPQGHPAGGAPHALQPAAVQGELQSRGRRRLSERSAAAWRAASHGGRHGQAGHARRGAVIAANAPTAGCPVASHLRCHAGRPRRGQDAHCQGDRRRGARSLLPDGRQVGLSRAHLHKRKPSSHLSPSIIGCLRRLLPPHSTNLAPAPRPTRPTASLLRRSWVWARHVCAICSSAPASTRPASSLWTRSTRWASSAQR